MPPKYRKKGKALMKSVSCNCCVNEARATDLFLFIFSSAIFHCLFAWVEHESFILNLIATCTKCMCIHTFMLQGIQRANYEFCQLHVHTCNYSSEIYVDN